MLAKLLVALGISVFSTLCVADQIFVSPQGDDGNDGNSPEAPVQTIKKAVSLAQPGDTVELMPANYFEPLIVNRSGMPGAPITFRSSGGSPAVLRSASVTKNAIELIGVNHIVIDGIHVDGERYGVKARFSHFARIDNSKHIVIRNGNFQYAQGWHGILVIGASSNVTIEDNYIDWVGEYQNETTGASHGDAIIVAEASNILVQKNTIKHGGHNLLQVDLKGTDVVVQDNYFDNSWEDFIGPNAGKRAVELRGNRVLFQRNYATGAGIASDDPTSSMIKVEGTNTIARHNVLAYGIAGGIQTASAKWSPNSARSRIYNNTFYNLGGEVWRMRYYDSGNTIGDSVFLNNLAINTSNNPIRSFSTSQLVFIVDVYGKGPTAGTTVKNNFFVNSNAEETKVLMHGWGSPVTFDRAQDSWPELFADNVVVSESNSSSPSKFDEFHSIAGSRSIDAGSFLTKVVGSGFSDRLTIVDALFFSDGKKVIGGDLIQLQDSTTVAEVTGVDYTNRVLTLNKAIDYSDGQGIALQFSGEKPDVGAHEAIDDTSGIPAAPVILGDIQ